MRTDRAFAALAAVDCALAGSGRQGPRRLTKPLLMRTLAVGRDQPTRRALRFSRYGDMALLRTSDAAFTVGLLSFLGAQVAWIVALRGRPSQQVLRRHPALAVPYVVTWAGLNAYLWRRAGKDRVPVLVYSTVLLAMALTALDSGGRAAPGGALFMASDSLIALERFAGMQLPAHEAWVMATYDVAQYLLATSGDEAAAPASALAATR